MTRRNRKPSLQALNEFNRILQSFKIQRTYLGLERFPEMLDVAQTMSNSHSENRIVIRHSTKKLSQMEVVATEIAQDTKFMERG
jgi:hypothetical protein